MKDMGMYSKLNRRDFLKLAALLPLINIKWPGIEVTPNGTLGNKDLPNILILIFDALSAKHLSYQGYNRNTTPNLARFVEKATVFHKHYAGGNFTTPGTASIFSGVYPWTHRALHLRGTVTGNFERKNLFSLSPPGVFKIAYTHNLLTTFLLHQFSQDLDVLKRTRDLSLLDNQYSDKLFSGDFSESFVSERLILRGGSEHSASLFSSLVYRILRSIREQKVVKEYENLFPKGVPYNNHIYYIMETAIDWINNQVGSLPKPNLMFVHLLPPHDPYFPRREFINLFDDDFTPVSKPPSRFSKGETDEFLNQRRREYDENIAYVDSEFGRLLDFMTQAGVLENTMVIFTSDHGELFERGIHGHVTETLYEPVIQVPLIISKPGQTQRQDVYTPTSCVDLLPTLLHIYGQEIPDWCEGTTLPIFDTQEVASDRSIYVVEAKSNPKYAPLSKATIALIRDQYKLIHYFGYEGVENGSELYNLATDPEELHDLYQIERSLAAQLQHELKAKLDEVNQPFN